MTRKLALLAIAPLALAACAGSSKTTTTTEPAPPAAEPAPAADQGAPPPAEAEPPPADRAPVEKKKMAEPKPPPPPPPPQPQPTVVALDFGKITGSALFKKFRKQLIAEAGPQMKELRKCGIRPLRALGAISLQFYKDIFDDEDDDAADTVMINGLRRKKIAGCADTIAKMMSERAEVAFEMEADGDYTRLEGDGESLWAYWLDGKTLVVGSPDTEKEALKSRAEKVRKGVSHADIDPLLAKLDRSRAVWFASSGGPMTAFGAVGLDEGLQIDVSLRFGNEGEAQAIHGQIQQQIQAMSSQMKALAPITDNLKTSIDGADLRVEIDMSMKDIDTMIQNAKTDPQLQQIIQTLTMQLG